MTAPTTPEPFAPQVEPKCPSCSASGMEAIGHRYQFTHSSAPNFLVVYCNQCGHVYGVLPHPTT